MMLGYASLLHLAKFVYFWAPIENRASSWLRDEAWQQQKPVMRLGSERRDVQVASPRSQREIRWGSGRWRRLYCR